MKTSLNILIAIFLIGVIACNTYKPENDKSQTIKKQRMPIKTVDEAIIFITNKFKEQEETLWLDNSLNDNTGMNMAIIGDKILKVGYMPNGFDQKNGFRIYKYKKF